MKGNIFKRSRGAIFFTFFKYAELAITASLMIFLAKKIGPFEMGKSVGPLLYITYASYFNFGTNTLIVKNYLIEPEKVLFLRDIIQILLIASVLNFILSFSIFNNPSFIFIIIISISIMFKNIFISYYRVVDKTWVLNINNIVSSSCLLILTLIFAKKWETYLLMWAITSLFSISIYFFYDLFFFKSIIKHITHISEKKKYIQIIKESSKLAIVVSIGTLFLTADRLIINNLDIANELKGNYQLADNISTAIFIGFSSIFFYYTPTIIYKIQKDKMYILKIFSFIKRSVIFFPFVVGILYLVSRYAVKIWFVEYKKLPYFVAVTILLKLLILISGVFTTLFLGLNSEKKYLKLVVIPISLLLCLMGAIHFYFSEIRIVFIPVLISCIVLLLIVLQKIRLNVLISNNL